MSYALTHVSLQLALSVPATSPLSCDHEVGNIVFVLNAIDAGRLDHLFVDAETKSAVRADWMAKGEAVARKYGRAYPGMFYETPEPLSSRRD
jgi:hypothetical protein